MTTQKFGGAWTQEKLNIFTSYLEAYLIALQNQNFKKIYIDAFAGTGKIEAICEAIGVAPEHIRTIIPLPKNYPDMEKVIEEEINYHSVSVVVCRRECIQTAKRHAAAAKAK